MDQAARGDAALSASNFDEAIQHFTSAISANPNAVNYYIKRSTAYQRSSKYSEALADAEIAVVLAHKRARRELIKDAQLRRAIALFCVGQYANADHIFGIVKKLDEKEKMLPIWTMKVAAKLKEIPEEDEQRKATVKDVPEVEVPNSSDSKSNSKEEAKPQANTVPVAKAMGTTPKEKIKHDWYQNNEKVTFNLMAKGVPKDKTTVEIEKDSLSISFPIEGSTDYSTTLDPLYAPVDPGQSSFRVLSTKIEVVLMKATPGVKWHALEGSQGPSPAQPTENKSEIPSHVLTNKSNQEHAPSYPTSAKGGVKNWDKLAKDDLEDADEEEGDETSRFFKQLYKGASPDAQRAMMKSYQESGGTVLSTDWSNVGNKYVKPEPPEGTEAKEY